MYINPLVADNERFNPTSQETFLNRLPVWRNPSSTKKPISNIKPNPTLPNVLLDRLSISISCISL